MFYINNELSEELTKVCDKIEYSIRIGIHHGPAVVGTFGNDTRSEFMAVGQTVQHAIDIKNVAAAGQILTSEIVRDLLSKDSWERAGTYNMESASGNVPLYELKVGESDKKAA
jgi:class 3 adenylate cyclase